MPSGTPLVSFEPAIWLALGPLVMACGGQTVDASNEADTTGSGDETTSEAVGSETAGASSTVGDGAGGSGTTSGTASTVSVTTTDTGTTGSSAELREAALERAARFVNDSAVGCKEEKVVTFSGADPNSAYPTRVLQTRGRPSPSTLCAEIADVDARVLCWQNLTCDFEWMDELDWSQWSSDATVVELVGLKPEQINLVHARFESRRDPADPNGPVIGFVSFYEQVREVEVPPGSHDCAYWWYLDPTPEGVALVLSSPMAGDLEGQLSSHILRLCLTE